MRSSLSLPATFRSGNRAFGFVDIGTVLLVLLVYMAMYEGVNGVDLVSVLKAVKGF